MSDQSDQSDQSKQSKQSDQSDQSKQPDQVPSRPIDPTPWGVLIGVVALAVIFWLVMTSSVPQPSSHPAVGRAAPMLDLVQLIPARPAEPPQPAQGDEPGEPDEAGEPAAASTLVGLPPAGSVTLLHFWGTWCPPCKLEYPELAEMVQAMQSEPRFRFVSVSCGTGGAEDFDSLQQQTASYYESIGIGDLETFADLSGETRRAISQQLNESVVYPTTILIDADQRIAGVWLGYSPAGVSEMQQAAQLLLRDSL